MDEEKKELDLHETQLPALSKNIPGIEDFPDTSVVIPRLIIGQPNNLSGYAEGKFINNLTQETFDKLNVVVLRFKRSRTLWPAGKPNKGDEPECRAGDAKKADIEFTGRECNRCNKEHDHCVDEKEQPVCEHAKFTEDFRPECRLGYHLLLIASPSGDVFVMTLTGKGISPTNKLLSNFKVRGRPPYSATLSISLEKSIDGNYYTIRYSDFKWLEDPEELKGMFDRFKSIQITTAKEEDPVILTE